MDVDNSTAKWNIEVNKWEWCDPCTQGQKSSTGKYLDFTITIKGNLQKSEFNFISLVILGIT